jgi:hypothetical protein
MDRPLSVPSKKTESISFADKVGPFLASQYGQDPGNYSAAILELTQLREKSIAKPGEASEYNLKAMMRCGFTGVRPDILQLLWAAIVFSETLSCCER